MAQKDFEKYKRLLHELVELMAKSDKIRDEMDEPWYNMTEEERNEIEQITEELYEKFNL